MKYSLMVYAENQKTFNIGDYVQSLAARQFLPQVDYFINREKLGEFKGGKTKLIMNGWFTHNAKNWVPSADIFPHLISFHINNTAAKDMLSEQGIEFLKKNKPIGCRDRFTEELLTSHGVEAYFSGCLTLTLDNYKVADDQRSNDIYIVDPLYGLPTKEKVFFNTKSVLRSIRNKDIFALNARGKFLSQMIDEEVLAQAVYIQQELPAKTYSEEEKFVLAEELLHKYARAKLVITSRIHCALPCLALGTPVIFVNGFDGFVDSCRLDGLAELFNRIDVDRSTGKISNNFNLQGKVNSRIQLSNPLNYLALAETLKKSCRDFINEATIHH